jgi:steroid delta-isomerase-like uncharacterized protein
MLTFKTQNSAHLTIFQSFQFWLRCSGLAIMTAITILFSFQAPAMAENSTADQNRSIALQYAREGWGTKPNWEKTWDKLLSPKLIFHFNSSAQPIVGLAENKEFNKSLFEGFPDIRQRIEDVVVDGNNVVYRHTIEGTNTGTFLGTPATGKPVKVNGFTQLKIANGKITEMWYECNLLEVMQQIGLIPRST